MKKIISSKHYPSGAPSVDLQKLPWEILRLLDDLSFFSAFHIYVENMDFKHSNVGSALKAFLRSTPSGMDPFGWNKERVKEAKREFRDQLNMFSEIEIRDLMEVLNSFNRSRNNQ